VRAVYQFHLETYQDKFGEAPNHKAFHIKIY